MKKIQLSEEERGQLESFMGRGKANARTIKRAQILLKSGEGWSLERIAETFGISQATVSNVRTRYHEGGVARVLHDKVQINRRRAMGGTEEAVLVALACSPVPDGHDHRTVRMLQGKLIELAVVEHVGYATVQRLLKKMNLNPGSGNRGVYPRK